MIISSPNLPSGCLPRCLCVFSSENRMKTRTTHCQKPSGFSQNQSLPVFPETVVGALCSDATEPHLGEYLVTWPPLGRLWAHVRVPCTPNVLLEDWQCFLHLPSSFLLPGSHCSVPFIPSSPALECPTCLPSRCWRRTSL